MSKNNSSSNGISFMGLLFICFLVLKLTKVIDWSWWWVTMPLWAGVAILLIILLLYFLALIFKDNFKAK